MVVLIILSIWLISPFLVPIVTGAVLAYLFYPVYKWLLKAFKKKSITAIVTAILIILIFIVPLIFAVDVISTEAYILYVTGKQKLGGDPLGGCEHSVCLMIKDWLADPGVRTYIDQGLEKMANMGFFIAHGYDHADYGSWFPFIIAIFHF